MRIFPVAVYLGMVFESIEFLPCDKSWFIRVAFLNFTQGNPPLALPAEANDDIRSMLSAIESWGNPTIPIGESGTAYRFLQFYSWKMGLAKEFAKGPMLAARNVCGDPAIVNLPQEELLKLDNGTSQWASAAALCGDTHRVENPPVKLALTYDVLEDLRGGMPDPRRPDVTIGRQADAFLRFLSNGHMDFVPAHAEDFCFAYAFGLISLEEGAARWPALASHESNRLAEMPAQIASLKENGVVSSTDHRVIQAVVMFALANNIIFRVTKPTAVDKSWPRFWDFLAQRCKRL